MHPGPITYRRGCCCPSLLTLHQDAPAPAQDAQIALITGAPQPYKSNRGRSQCGGIPRGVWGVSIYHLGCPPCGLELTSTTRLTIGISSTTWLMNVPHITISPTRLVLCPPYMWQYASFITIIHRPGHQTGTTHSDPRPS